MPGAVLGHERKWERPVLRADMQNVRTVGVSHEPMHFLISADESFAVSLVCDWIFRRNVSPENLAQRFLIVGPRGEVQRTRRLLRGRKGVDGHWLRGIRIDLH